MLSKNQHGLTPMGQKEPVSHFKSLIRPIWRLFNGLEATDMVLYDDECLTALLILVENCDNFLCNHDPNRLDMTVDFIRAVITYYYILTISFYR
jgi:hypothetical protein